MKKAANLFAAVLLLACVLAFAYVTRATRPPAGGFGAPTAVGGKYYGIIIRFTPPASVAGETLAHYNVYRAEGPACATSPFTLINSALKNKNATSVIWYDFTAFDPSSIYWYKVSAVDTAGVESPQSACIEVPIPAGD